MSSCQLLEKFFAHDLNIVLPCRSNTVLQVRNLFHTLLNFISVIYCSHWELSKGTAKECLASSRAAMSGVFSPWSRPQMTSHAVTIGTDGWCGYEHIPQLILKEWISVQKCHQRTTLAVHTEDFVLLDVKPGLPCENNSMHQCNIDHLTSSSRTPFPTSSYAAAAADACISMLRFYLHETWVFAAPRNAFITCCPAL